MAVRMLSLFLAIMAADIPATFAFLPSPHACPHVPPLYGMDRRPSHVSSQTGNVENETVAATGSGNWLVTFLLPLYILSGDPGWPAWAADWPQQQGIPAVTRSELGLSVRTAVVGGAQIMDRLDLQWERFGDGLRDQGNCDPQTNRRLFDNGHRRDGTPIGNPVLGALCTPEPLTDLDDTLARVVLETAQEAARVALQIDAATLVQKQEQVQRLVGPAFSRALSSSEDPQTLKRQTFNRDLYAGMRALGELFTTTGPNDKLRETARLVERTWGDQLLTKLAPTANRNDYRSPFPKPDDTADQPYDEGALLDALGAVSVALERLQQSGLIGHWEMSIPEDDYWTVVTIAVDDDISIGGQILARGRGQPLDGSVVTALVRAAMENRAKISYTMDTFFIDPTTTKQELYNPTQLLISLSDLGQ